MTIVLVLIFISILILVHEWGHFYVARRLGVKVEEFGFGFPPRLFSRIRGGVRYSFNLLPFGGFVRIFGEHGEGEGNRASFVSRPARERFIILAAGVVMNLILAWVLFSGASAIGLPRSAGEGAGGIPVSILGVLSGSPAEQAGVKLGDQILEIRAPEVSLRIEKEEDVRQFADAYKGEEIAIVIRRQAPTPNLARGQGEIREFTVVPRLVMPEGEGPLGVVLGRIVIERSPWYLAPISGAVALTNSIFAIIGGLVAFFSQLLGEGRVPAGVSGPIGILLFAQDSVALGIAYFLQFIGLLSVNLAILNFLPIPALDGGRVLFLAIEKIKGSRVNPRVEQVAHALGFILLVLLMLLVTYQDIARVL